uniref:Uncharacterized protein n=1 Tax=Arundo donax TaxID=35708 RepID=A0A0A9C3A3_ARUDO
MCCRLSVPFNLNISHNILIIFESLYYLLSQILVYLFPFFKKRERNCEIVTGW